MGNSHPYGNRPGDRMAEFIIDILTEYYFWGALGFFIGCFISIPNLLKNDVSFPKAVILIVAGIYGGLFGSRILYVLIKAPHLFKSRPLAGLYFWQGGLAWQGGIILGAFAVLLVARIIRLPAWESLGCIAPGYAFAHAITRIGCLIRGCCFGCPTNVPWAIYSKELGTKVHPTQIYSMIGELASFAILQYLFRKKEYRKYLFPLYGLFFGLHRFIAEFFRGVPPGPELISGLRIYQVICILIFSASLATILILRDKKSGIKFSALIVIITAAPFVLFRPESPEQTRFTGEGGNLYLVATRTMFEDDLSKWKSLREEQGFRVVVKSWKKSPTSEEVSGWFRKETKGSGGRCAYILLVGDCASAEETGDPYHIPSFFIPNQVEVGTKAYITDLPYGDPDNDLIPDIPVGRLPVRNRRQLRAITEKIFSFEKQNIDRNRFRAVIWSGAKGYDREMYQITTSLASKGIPGWLDRFIISGKTDSAYSSWPPDQPEIFLEEISDPAFMSLVVSHGSFRSVTPANFKNKEIFLSNEHVERFRSEAPLGPLFMIGCNSGEFNIAEGTDRSLAEAFIRHSGGPASVVAASGPTSPLTNYFFSSAMLSSLETNHITIGNYFLSIQQAMSKTRDRTPAELAYEHRFAGNLLKAVPEREKSSLKQTGLTATESMRYNLFGDPALPLYQPQHMAMTIEKSEGNRISVSGKTPENGGLLTIDIIQPDRKIIQLPPGISPEERKERFRNINRPAKILEQKTIEGEQWETDFELPEDFDHEKDHLRFLIIGENSLYYHIYPRFY